VNFGEEEDAWLDGLKDKASSGEGIGNGIKSKNRSEKMISSIESLMHKKEPNERYNKGQESINSRMTKCFLTKGQVYNEIVPFLAMESETILQALSRYGAIIKREKKLCQNEKIKRDKNVKHESASTRALDRLTELSSLCMMKFDDTNVYEHTRENLIRILKKNDVKETVKRKRGYFNSDVADKEGISGDSRHACRRSKTGEANRKADKVQWEYRGNKDYAIHGPYDTIQMLQWIKAGYFMGETAVDVRKVAAIKDDKIIPITREEAADDLLGDLEDIGGEEGGGGERGPKKFSASSSEWLKSDQVDFSLYL